MTDRSGQQPAQHSPGPREPYPTVPAMSPADIAAHDLASYVRPRAQDEDPNGPVIPEIPGPRKPRTAVLPATAQAAISRLERALGAGAVTA